MGKAMKLLIFILFLIPVFGQAQGVFPLSTCNRFVVDKNGYRYKFKGINWYGAQEKRFVNEGLHKRPLKDIVKLIKKMGFNTIRLPFSNEMLRVKKVDKAHLLANPEFFDMTPLEVFDEVIKALTDEGISVILNNHSSAAIWCCLYEEDGLWYTREYPEDVWVEDWVMLVNRYRNNPGVIAADLRNEIRVAKWKGTFIPSPPRWGSGSKNDWKRAAEKAGNAILKVNPNILVVVEGINFPRYHLRGVKRHPIQLIRPSQLVYSVHNYSFTGPKILGGKKYGEMDWEEYEDLMDEEFGFILDRDYHDPHPVWLSEFGEGPKGNKKWFDMITRYMDDKDLDFAYWPLNGGAQFESGAAETYGLITSDYKTPLNDWRQGLLNKLLKTKISWDYEKAKACIYPDYQALPFDYSDSYGGKDLTDQYPNFFNANCADDSRMVGLSVGRKWLKNFAKAGLCSRKSWGLKAGPPSFIENTDKDSPTANSRTKKDWDEGYNKLECGPNQYVTAITQWKKGIRLKITGVQCSQSLQKIMLSTKCKALVIDNDNRLDETPKDWSFGYKKGQCSVGDYMAGISVKDGYPHGILCCNK